MTNGDARKSDGAGGGGPTRPGAVAQPIEALDPSDLRAVADDGGGGGGPTKIRDAAAAPVIKSGTVGLTADGAGGGGPTGPHKLADDGAGGGGPTGPHK